MPYTLTAGLLWYSGALLLGLILGWLLRSTSAIRQVGRARRTERAAVQQELSDLKARADAEEELRLERNRLRHDNELLREQLASRPAVTGETPAPENDDVEQVKSSAPDLEEGARVLGRRLSTDDLQLINGIGPVIEGLLNGVGIHSWSDLAAADVDILASALVDGATVQTAAVNASLGARLAEVGARLGDVIKAACFPTGTATVAEFGGAYVYGFGDSGPARSMSGVAELPLGTSVEIEALAHRRPRG